MHTVLNLCFAKSLRQKIWRKNNIAAHEFSDKILCTPSIRYPSTVVSRVRPAETTARRVSIR